MPPILFYSGEREHAETRRQLNHGAHFQRSPSGLINDKDPKKSVGVCNSITCFQDRPIDVIKLTSE